MLITKILLTILTGMVFQDAPRSPDRPTRTKPVAPAVDTPAIDVTPETIDAAVKKSVEILLSRQEGPGNAEWPYEGVYRVRGSGPREFISRGAIIPLGYRIGGTSIAGMALLHADGLGEDQPRKDALERARNFVVASTADPTMTHEYDGGYDVRGWGYIYGLRFLVAMKAKGLVPEDSIEAHDEAMQFYLDGMTAIEIPDVGGWNYARRGPLDSPSAASPFMTAPGLQALIEAKALGLKVDDAMIARGYTAMELSRKNDGHVAYSAQAQTRESSRMLPGAIGRMVAMETVRMQGGRGNAEDTRRAVSAFCEHWNELLKRKSKNGTHDPPYGVAPYYFFYAHGYAAEAIEQLPEEERGEWRAKLLALMFSVREDDDSWNDRVFPRSKAYGTATALQVLTQPKSANAPQWTADVK